MFKTNDYVVYRGSVCIIDRIDKLKYNNKDYYVLKELDDPSILINIPVDTSSNLIRKVITLEEVNNIIKEIPNIKVITSDNKVLDSIYKDLYTKGRHEDLISIIKTTYLRNSNRISSNKKISEKDMEYFNMAEKSLYSEFAIILGMSYDETKQYVINSVNKNINSNV